MLTSLAPARRRLVVGLAGLLVAGLVTMAAALAFATRDHAGMPAGPVRQDRPGPVLLVPGYGAGTDRLKVLAGVLAAAGRDVTVVDLPDRALGDLDQQADALDEAVGAAMARTGAASVDVVGYSAGGVVARLWLTEHDGAARARRVVTLGSPHQGTQLAVLAGLLGQRCPLACQQLATGSDLLRGLASTSVPAGVPFVSIWSTDDEVVVPPDSASVEGAVNVPVQGVCAGARLGHGGLPTDPTVQHLVLEALGTGTVPTWTGADCARLSS
ncbi:MAG TPA: alpha/beta fold hydrolase [Dermatophilaceae bacterium]|nr:alpha/beta fold hydrolase [Dermatophilaceae bacterium]